MHYSVTQVLFFSSANKYCFFIIGIMLKNSYLFEDRQAVITIFCTSDFLLLKKWIFGESERFRLKLFVHPSSIILVLFADNTTFPIPRKRTIDQGTPTFCLNATGVPLATTAELTLEALVVSSQRMSGEFLPSFEAGQKKVASAEAKHL